LDINTASTYANIHGYFETLQFNYGFSVPTLRDLYGSSIRKLKSYFWNKLFSRSTAEQSCGALGLVWGTSHHFSLLKRYRHQGMFGHDMMGFRTRIVLGVLAAVLFAEKIKGQGLVPGNDGPVGASNDTSKDWPNFIAHISGSFGGTGSCVECVLCSDCFSGCDNITSFDDDGNAIGCPTEDYGQNTDEYWICACNKSNRIEVDSQIMNRAASCSFISNAQSEAVNTFASFCSFISSAITTTSSAPVTDTGQNSVATPPAFATAGTPESSTVSRTTSTSNSNFGLASMLLINDED